MQAEQGTVVDDALHLLTVGKIVQVEARTWPGINKPGGVGRITQLHYDGEKVTSVDVRYTVVGGRERHVPIEHVQAAPEFDSSVQGNVESNGSQQNQQRSQALRDRSGLLGRCKRCGSLRADCQSCDWREQERLARNPQPEATSNTTHPKRRSTKARKRNVQTRQVDDESLSSSSSSSSSEDEEESRADNLRRRRRYRKQKAFWLRAFDDSDSQEDQSQESSSDDDSDNDPLLARLAELKRRRREAKKRELAEKYQVTSKKKKKKRTRRPRSTGLSTLESLTAPRVNATAPARPSDGKEPESPPPSEPKRQVQVEDVGDSDVSSQDSLLPPPPDDEAEEELTVEQDSPQVVEIPGASLDLEGMGGGFIQPEGEAAAEHLPSDIVDRTQSIPYKQLPVFFHDLLTELQDEVIPDAAVDISEFKRKTRDARNRNDNDALRRLEQEGSKLYDEIQRKVIKNGVDQCREAMRRMTDPHQRRRHKKSMTGEELKQFRSVALEAKDNQLDLMVPKAEELLRDAIAALLDEFRVGGADEFDIGDDEVSESSDQSSSDVSASMMTQDLISMSADRSYVHNERDEATSLPAFDPHQHATTVRTKTSAAKPKGKRNPANNRSRRMQRKRQDKRADKHTSADTASTDVQPDGRATRKRKRRGGQKRSASKSHHSDKSFASDPDPSSSEGDSMSVDTSSREPLAHRQRRRAATSKSRRHQEHTGIQFPSANERSFSTVPMADKMQAFLDANSSNIDDFDGFSRMSDGSEDERRTEGRSQRRAERRAKRSKRESIKTSATNEDTGASYDDGDSPVDQDGETATSSPTNAPVDAFYDRLSRKPRAPMGSGQPPVPVQPAGSFSESCQMLLVTYRDSRDGCASLFDSIVHHFRDQTSIVHSEAAEVFAVLSQLLQENGSMILQAVALTEANKFRRHIRLLVFALSLIDCKVHTGLEIDDGIAFKLFGRENWKKFVEMIILQMMDVIYARTQPDCWGLDRVYFSSVIEKLIPLRNAVGRLVPVVERVSQCTLEKLQCQTWRQLDSSKAIVSAVDPQEYKSLLLTGSASSSAARPGSVRFQSFKKGIPGRETETLWLLLAFSAESPGAALSIGSKYRWRLIASMFGNNAGMLAKVYFESTSQDETKLPPHNDHIARCLEELNRFGVIVSSAALNPLPDSDSFLTKMFQKCLLLQTQEYRYSSDDSGQELLCNLSAADLAHIARTWKDTNLLNKNAVAEAIAQDSAIPEKQRAITRQMTSLLSVSTLLQSCMNLSMAWIQQVPTKKARRSRLTQSLNKLVVECVDSASKLEATNTQDHQVGAGSTFAEAFAVPTTNTGSLYAATAYREAASRLSVIQAVGGSNGTRLSLTKELRERVWQMMCDSGMNRRQQSLVASEVSSGDSYAGDCFRLFCTAKTIAWLANLHWLPLDGMVNKDSLGSLPESLATELDDDKDMFSFLVSCLGACLDCACDLFEPQTNGLVHHYGADEATLRSESVAAAISCICSWLSQLCFRSRDILHSSIDEAAEAPLLWLHRAAKELKLNVFGVLASPLKKCLLRLTNSTFHGENTSLALLSVLGLVRAVVGVTATSVEATGEDPGVAETTPVQHTEQTTNDDLFGSMDDDLFMNIDIGSSVPRTGETPDKDAKEFKELWAILIDMIKLTKPSKRFDVLPPTVAGTNAGACMSIPGRAVAANNIGGVCACLAVLTSLDKQDSPTVNLSLDTFASSMKAQGWIARDDADQRYFRSVAQCFYSEVCSLSAEYEQCDLLVRKRWEVIVEHFVDAMLDSNTLERFPSMNLKRIKENGGARSERKQSLRIKLANSTRQPEDPSRESVNEAGARLGKSENGDSPGPSYNSSRLWSFCESFGKAAARRDGGTELEFREFRIETLLADLDSELMDRPRDLVSLVSLEKECLLRMLLFRGILSSSARRGSTTGALSFESLSNKTISCCCYELASISKGVHYQARFGRKDANGGKKSYKHTRLIELQSCYTELTVGLLSWILRACPGQRSAVFESVLQCVRDQLFAQVLLRKTGDIHQSLQNLYTVATPDAIGCHGTARSSTPTDTDESGVLNDIFVAIVSRSREIMLHLAKDQRYNGMRNVYCLLSSFVTLAMRCKENSVTEMKQDYFLDLITTSLDGDNRGASAVTRLSTGMSPFQQALDDYMRHVKPGGAVDSGEDLTAMHQLRHIMMRQFLVPKLLKDDVLVSHKKGILHLLSFILQIEARRNSLGQQGLEPHLIASMAKGIASCMRSSLESHVVDDDLVCLAFKSAKDILTFPLLQENSQEETTVLSWSRRCGESNNDSTQPPYALYLWTFASWLNDVGTTIVGRTDQDKQEFQAFRSKAMSMAVQGQSIWNGTSSCSDSDAAIVRGSSRLVSLEARVFVEKENARPVANVYAKSRPKQQLSVDPSESSEWTPSSSVRRVARELEAKVIAVL